ncbi:hypothetical protein ACIRPP_30335 [Streptomyces sp. NPDC101219]|uniref:hypothetical protein n=1 Tax=Streptomyces sp. NPDC101219 TaxID=3366131 RepID=UPI0038071DA3
MSADTAVSEVRSVLAAEGIEVDREPSDGSGRCLERLHGRHSLQRAEAAVRAAFARARSEYGWRTGPDMGAQTLTLAKGNWTVVAPLPGEAAQGLDVPVVVSMTCVDGGGPADGDGDGDGASAGPVPPSSGDGGAGFGG